MKPNLKAKSLNLAFGITDDKCKIYIDEIKQELKEKIKSGKDRLSMTSIMNDVITVVRKEHLNTTEEPSAYEFELLFQGYLVGKLTSNEFLRTLEIECLNEMMQEKGNNKF